MFELFTCVNETVFLTIWTRRSQSEERRRLPKRRRKRENWLCTLWSLSSVGRQKYLAICYYLSINNKYIFCLFFLKKCRKKSEFRFWLGCQLFGIVFYAVARIFKLFGVWINRGYEGIYQIFAV